MGILSTYDKLKAKLGVSKQVREAADQMWVAVMQGKTFEVPIVLNSADPSMQAVWLLFKLHPEMRVAVRQSRSFIITHPDRVTLAAETQELMRKGGQFASPGEFTSSIERMLGGQAAFLEKQGLDPEQMEKEAQEAQAKKHALVLDASGTPATLPGPTEPTP